MEKKNDVKDLKEEKDVKDEKKEHNSADAKIEALIEMGKSKGVLTYKEVMDTLDDLELDSEQIERIYDRFEAAEYRCGRRDGNTRRHHQRYIRAGV